MTTHSLLFGIRAGTLEEAKRLVEGKLPVTLDPRSSTWLGDYYGTGWERRESMELQWNFVAQEGDWTEPEHRSWPILLYVEETDRAAELKELLCSIDQVQLLRTETD